LGARPENLNIDLSQTALICVDMQNAFVSKGGMFDLAGFDISKSADVIRVHQRLLPACRKAGVRSSTW
jgi:ureidoacrylate peracid hydrolase